MLRSFVISGSILGVKNNAEIKNDICRRISLRSGAVLVNFSVNGVVLPPGVMLVIILGVKQHTYYENMIAE